MASKTINPLEVSAYSKLMTEATFNKYKSSWIEFCREENITCDNPPKKENFEKFFESKREAGMAGTTIRSLYSHLNKMYECVYSRQLKVSLEIEIQIEIVKLKIVYFYRILMVFLCCPS